MRIGVLRILSTGQEILVAVVLWFSEWLMAKLEPSIIEKKALAATKDMYLDTM
jgi:hypothetical protein